MDWNFPDGVLETAVGRSRSGVALDLFFAAVAFLELFILRFFFFLPATCCFDGAETAASSAAAATTAEATDSGTVFSLLPLLALQVAHSLLPLVFLLLQVQES